MLPLDLAALLQHGTWAVEEAALAALISISPAALQAFASTPLQNALQATVRDGVAVLPVEGVLCKRANVISEALGYSDYSTIRQDLQTALDDPSVKAILLNINSPGGEVAGCAELAQAIRDACGQKPIVSICGDLAASAAYWICSAADRVYVGPSAALGSIGVRAGFTDTSVRDARSGVKSIEFISSQSPYKGADTESDDGRARIQARVDALADVFIDAVASNRGVPRDQVLSDFGKGDVFIGRAAIDAGLADEMGSFESVLASLVAGKAVTRPTSRMKIVQNSIASKPTAATVPKSAPVPPHIAAERARGLEIVRLAAGNEALAAQALAEGWEVGRLRETIAAEAVAQTVLTHFPRR